MEPDVLTGFIPKFAVATLIFSYILWSIFLNQKEEGKLRIKTGHDIIDIIALTSLNLFFLWYIKYEQHSYGIHVA